MSVLTICGVAVIASILAVILRKNNNEYSVILTIAASVILVFYLIATISDTLDGVKEIYRSSQIDISYLNILLKATGICFITEFVSDVCKDSGQASLSNITVFGGKLFVVISALPLFSDLLSLVLKLAGS